METLNNNIHTPSGRWRLGLALSFLTTILWGILPIALKGLMDHMDAFTITWFRFFIAALFLFIFIKRRNRLPLLLSFRYSQRTLLIISGVGLCANYILYILGLNCLSPSTATIVIQLAPIFMLIGALILFKESFGLQQWFGFCVLLIGIILFFNDRFDELISRLDRYSVGVILIVVSGIFWAIYALAQKQALKSLPSENIMFFVYLTGTLLFFPFAKPLDFFTLNGLGLVLLLFCAFNTLIAYGSFAEALNHWEASRISMILATIPLITVAGMKMCGFLFPGFISPERLNMLSIIGAFLVVSGSVLCVVKRIDHKTRE